MKLLILVACLLNVAITVPVRERHPSRVTKKPETEHHGVRRRVERSASGSSEMRMTRFIVPRQQQADIPPVPPVPNIPPIPIPVPVPIPLDPTAINAAGMPIAQYLVPAPAQFYPGFPGMAVRSALPHTQGFPPILGVSSQMAWMRNPNCPTEYPGLGKANRLEDLPGPHQL
ncbi:SH3 domain-containing protein C23A1.17-like isoform X2 [Crotalus tigris]|nr:SH3 domain-containing protein C23A1.17-like isoform X2 [Crotalus tigris]XP_039217147.1 SH3 domain-containing protein C23A1.17-like isoform X2 [Crotalus tigris]